MSLAHKVPTTEAWHALRAENVGASEVAALFGLSPYVSRFTLWHQKAGKVARPEFSSERMEWGNLLEGPIATHIAAKQGWEIRKVKTYLTHEDVPGMGASLDFEILNHPDGPGCFEIKNVDSLVFRNQWLNLEDGSLQAPIHIEMQLQHQLSVTGYAWGAIGLLVGGNEAHVLIRKRHAPTIARIEAEVASFWESIRKGEAPSITDIDDLPVIGAMPWNSDTVYSHDPALVKACDAFVAAREAAKLAEKEKDKAKVALIAALAEIGADSVILPDFRVTFKEVKREKYTVKASVSRSLRVADCKERTGFNDCPI